MTREAHRILSRREQLTQGGALMALLIIGALAIAGPSGLLAWSENLRLLDKRQAQIAKLSHDRNELKQLVDGLDPNHADPDLVGELIRENLNVVHPDEVVISLEPGQN
ncbi:MAG: FtsB family cell division protein [Tsuneonella sp.]